MKLSGKLVACFLAAVSLSFVRNCEGKSRSTPFQYRRFTPGSVSTPWRSYGGGYAGVLGGIGGENGDLGYSYRSSRNADQQVGMYAVYYPQPLPPVELRSVRDTNYWNSYGVYNSPSYACEFSCDDGTCLKKEYRCDGYAQCWDGSDEKSCSCSEIISDAKICDGYKDCPDGADEKDCVYGCQSDEFTCDTHNSGSRVKCVPVSKRCDGYNDCPQGNDEHDCFRMVDLFDDEQRGVRSSGILQKRLGDDQWHTVCKTSSSSQHAATFAEKACLQIVGHVDGSIKVTTKSLSQMKLQMSKQQVQQLKYIRLAEIEAKFAVLGMCASDLVYEVQCPPPQCGGHGNYEGYRRRRSLETEDEDADVDVEEDEIENSIEEDDETDERELIVGGYATEEMKWPFLVGIFRDGEFYCGGSIISENYILTAAHCCHGYDKHVFEVQAGMTRRLSWSPYEQTRMVEEIYVHEDYNSKIFANDIAVYKLDKPLHFSKYVTPACLPTSIEDDPVGGQGCKVAGWGDLSESGSGPDHMQEVELPILSKCKETFTRDTYQICAGYPEGGKDACQGDSGGPLMCINPNGKPVVNGVVSFGRGCARKNEAGAYTRISAYRDWINKVVAGEISHGNYYPRPKQCTEKCYKPGGECLYPEEKCSGNVECLGAKDELSCSHPISRNHVDHLTTSNYMPFYPQSYYAPPPQQQQQQFGVLSRSRPNEPVTYYTVLPPPPSYQIPYPFLISRSSSHQRNIRRVFTQCDSTREFECATKTERTKFTECVLQTRQCDRSPDCTDKSDEFNCIAVTTDFREPTRPSSLTQMNEAKGYIISRFQGDEWHFLVTRLWTLPMGQQTCQMLLGSNSAQLKSLETISIEDLAKQVQKTTGMDLMKGTVIKLDANVNEDVDSESSVLLSSDNKMFGHPGQMSKINLNREQQDDATVHLNDDESNNLLMVGFVQCAMP